MTDHEPCPECRGQPRSVMMFEDSNPGCCAGFVAGCFAHWRGPVKETEAEALEAWDKVVGPFWNARTGRARVIGRTVRDEVVFEEES